MTLICTTIGTIKLRELTIVPITMNAQNTTTLPTLATCKRLLNTSKFIESYFYSLPWPQLWVDIPLEETCYRDASSDGLGPLLPTWLSAYTYADTEIMADVECDRWYIPDDTSEYWDRTVDGVPMRYSPGDEKQQWYFDPVRAF